MTNDIAIHLSDLRRLRAGLESSLRRDSTWIALTILEAKPGTEADRERLRLEIGQSPVFRAWKKVAEAIDVLEAVPTVATKAAFALESAGDPEAPADDFTAIRSIDRALAARLQTLGVRTYAQIAALTAADVRGLAAELEFGRRIHAENWIEQAAILAGKRKSPLAA